MALWGCGAAYCLSKPGFGGDTCTFLARSSLLQPYLLYFPQYTRAPVYTILDQIQTQSHSSEGALSSLESSLEDRDKQINQLREQRDRAEKADMQPVCDDVS